METKGSEIPESHIEFAKGIAELAKKHGIDKFDVSYEPERDSRIVNHDSRIPFHYGKIDIHYHQSDGRGRPSENLSISFDKKVIVPIVTNPESYS